jgi:hypothetical protein
MDYEIESIEPLNIERDTLVLDNWSKYILSRRQAYFEERAMIIGPEYNMNKKSWDIIIEREWGVMEERLRGGIGVEQEVIDEFGAEFFNAREELIAEIIEMTSHLPTTILDGEDRKELKIYTFEDFLMLSNQGIFRENTFLLDPQSKWKRKVATTLMDYGYQPRETIIIEGVRHYVIGRTE